MLDGPPTLWDFPAGDREGWTFLELRGFSQRRDRHFETDGHFADFQASLAWAPEQGALMQGCGGLRKTRFPDLRRGKGKRGGLRILYLLLPEIRTIVLVDVYDKDEADDLTAQQKKTVARLVKAIKSELTGPQEATGAEE